MTYKKNIWVKILTRGAWGIFRGTTENVRALSLQDG